MYFSASAFRLGRALPENNKFVVGQGEVKETDLVPNSSGGYPLECAELLHAMFGMTGVTEVGSEGPPTR